VIIKTFVLVRLKYARFCRFNSHVLTVLTIPVDQEATGDSRIETTKSPQFDLKSM